MLIKLFALLLLAATVSAEYLPSGSRSSYNADVDSSRLATGGPLRNYLDGSTWREIKTDLRLDNGALVSDSGFHSFHADLATNIVRLDWQGHILKLEVAPLFAYRRSTNTRTKLANPNFTNRSFSGSTITIRNIYPNVDLDIINTPDAMKHRFTFHQAARDAFDTWWANNGSLEDIYLVNTFRLDVDSLGLRWADSAGNFDMTSERDLTRYVRLKSGTLTKFFLTKTEVWLDAAPGGHLDLYKRLMLIGGTPYLAEGFRWVDARLIGDGPLKHDVTFGNESETADFNLSGNRKLGSPFMMGGTPGIADSIYSYNHNAWGDGPDLLQWVIYTDSSDHGGTDSVPAAMVDTTDSYITISGSNIALYGQEFTRTVNLSANTLYWLMFQCNDAYYGRSAGTGNDRARREVPDTRPLDNPSGAGAGWTEIISVYVVYSIGGDGLDTRRRLQIIRSD